MSGHCRPLTEVERQYLRTLDRLRTATDAGAAREARREMRRLVVVIRLEAGVADPDTQERSYRNSVRERLRDESSADQPRGRRGRRGRRLAT